MKLTASQKMHGENHMGNVGIHPIQALADIGQSFETVQNRTLVKPPICLNPQP
jgi:hypothetical protein